MFNWIKNYIAEIKAFDELNRMSDRELRDIGINKSQILSISKNKFSR